jgi:hypothetical protein
MPDAGPKPRIPYWHLWTGPDGISRQTRCELTDYQLQGVGGAAPQWIVVLSGRWWIEAMDGTRIEQGPGEFSLGEDQGCATVDGRKGHRSGTIGDQPAVLMTVQLHVPPTRSPCHFS